MFCRFATLGPSPECVYSLEAAERATSATVEQKSRVARSPCAARPHAPMELWVDLPGSYNNELLII